MHPIRMQQSVGGGGPKGCRNAARQLCGQLAIARRHEREDEQEPKILFLGKKMPHAMNGD
jgi:hypothetical protein